MSKNLSTKKLVLIAMFSAIAFVLMNFEIAIPSLFPGFLKFDISELPVIFSTLSLGPIAGIVTELLKNVLHLFRTQTSGVGELANFLVGCSLIIPIGIFRNAFIKNKKNTLLVLLLSILSMTIGGIFINAFITLPLYEIFTSFTLEGIIAMSNQVVPMITDKLTLLLFAFAPFNLIKATALAILTLGCYKPILKSINRILTN